MKRRRERKAGQSGRSVEDILYPTLDLHGYTALEATREAERWLETRWLAGDPVVRLVTGRGLHSVGPPVLPDAIDTLLRRLKRTWVKAFEREPGGGAFRVQLRGLSGGPKPAPSPRMSLDPELVRLAEEALSELGITPTPPLVEAEVRRIAKGRE